METITFKDFIKASKSYTYYNKARWDYYKVVIDMIKFFNPKTVLELGAYKLPIVKDGDTIDILKKVNPTYCQDAKIIPWKIYKHYDMFIALQVWEHLGNKQRDAFKEVMRISDMAILSFPYLWDFGKKDKIHYMIDCKKISYWTLGIIPVYIKRVDKRLIYLFDFR